MAQHALIFIGSINNGTLSQQSPFFHSFKSLLLLLSLYLYFNEIVTFFQN